MIATLLTALFFVVSPVLPAPAAGATTTVTATNGADSVEPLCI